MSQENISDHSYRFGYAVCALFLVGFILITLAVISDAIHRAELEQVVVVPSATPGNH
jgi:hypothetical protein